MDQPEEKRKSVLMVEDDTLLAAAIVPLLVEKGYSVNLVTDGEAAMSLIRLRYYDFVYLDIMLPYVSGLDVLKRLKSPEIRVGPVVVFSGLTREVAESKAMEFGATEYVFKGDVTPQQVADKAASYVNRSSQD